jgi:hypothetical protein
VPASAPSPAPFKRVDTLSEEALRKQLLTVPEIALDRVPNTSRQLFVTAQASHLAGEFYPGPVVLLAGRPEFHGLPFLSAKNSRLREEQAADLELLSESLHGHLQACTTGADARQDPDILRQLLGVNSDSRGAWNKPEALRTVLQILQAEQAPVRQLLVELLRDMDDPRAQAVLAIRAMFDLSPEVRQAAVGALAGRRPETYRRLLLAGFRYPWPAAAAHAAEALVALGDTGAVPALRKLLQEPLPSLVSAGGAKGRRVVAVRELVRLNHLGNCLLCHPPSLSFKDHVRGAIPALHQPGTPGFGYFGAGGTPDQDFFVRADVTYLRQDFSLRQPIPRHSEKSPDLQRFDYLVRVRPLSAMDWSRFQQQGEQLAQEYRATVEFALRELTAEKPPG